jgi:hypothetical protein
MAVGWIKAIVVCALGIHNSLTAGNVAAVTTIPLKALETALAIGIMITVTLALLQWKDCEWQSIVTNNAQ